MYCLSNSCFLCLNSETSLVSINIRDSDKKTIYDKLNYCMKDLQYVKPASQTKICKICCDILRVVFEFKRKCFENNKNLVEYVKKLSQNSGNYAETYVMLNDSEFHRYKNNTTSKEAMETVAEDKQHGDRAKVSPEDDMYKYLSMYDFIKLFPKRDRKENMEEINLSSQNVGKTSDTIKENGESSTNLLDKYDIKKMALRGHICVRLERLDEKIINDLQKRNEEQTTEDINLLKPDMASINEIIEPVNEEISASQEETSADSEEISTDPDILTCNEIIDFEDDNSEENMTVVEDDNSEEIMTVAEDNENGQKESTAEDFLHSVIEENFKNAKNMTDKKTKDILACLLSFSKEEFLTNKELIKPLIINLLTKIVEANKEDTLTTKTKVETNKQALDKEFDKHLQKEFQPIETSEDFEALISTSTICPIKFTPEGPKNNVEEVDTNKNPRQIPNILNRSNRSLLKKQNVNNTPTDAMQFEEIQSASPFGVDFSLKSSHIVNNDYMNMKYVLGKPHPILEHIYVAREEIIPCEEKQTDAENSSKSNKNDVLFELNVVSENCSNSHEIVIKNDKKKDFILYNQLTREKQPTAEETNESILTYEHNYASKKIPKVLVPTKRQLKLYKTTQNTKRRKVTTADNLTLDLLPTYEQKEKTSDDKSAGDNSGLKLHRCVICFKAFVCENSLNLHMNLHPKIYECTICQSRFKFKYCLLKHLSRHKGEKVYLCPFCPLQYGNVQSLTTHCTNIHKYVPINFETHVYKGTVAVDKNVPEITEKSLV